MSRNITLFLIFVLLATLSAACTAANAADSQEDQTESAPVTQVESSAAPRTITVVGEGQISLEPDMAVINVGAEARAGTVSEAKSEVEAHMAAILATLQEMGIADRDVQTSHYGIHFEREPMPMMLEGPAPEIREEYYVSNMLQVTVRDVEMAGEVLDAVVQSGANQVYGVTYSVSDETAWQSQARSEAMADARSHAQELAALTEVELGEVLSVSEVVGGMVVPFLRVEQAMGGGGIAPGELEFSTQIQVIFAIK